MNNEPEILKGTPSEPGWYAAYVSIPEDGDIRPAFWDGSSWSWEEESRNYKIVWAYAQKFESERDAEAWIEARNAAR